MAQSGDDGGKRPGAGRLVWFACLSKPEGLEDPVTVMAGGKLAKLELPEFMASRPVSTPADGIIRIVRETPDPANQGRMRYLILAEAKIPDGVREALVILSPLSKPHAGLFIQSQVQDLSKFKGGDRLFINLSDTNIRVRLGKEMVAVEPRRANIYKAPAMKDEASVPIMYEFYYPERKEWMILSASTIAVTPTRREICVFNNGSRIGNIRTHGILFPVPQEKP